MRPALGGIQGLPIDVLGPAAVLREAVGFPEQAAGPRFKAGGGQPPPYSTCSASSTSSQSVPAKPPSTRTWRGALGTARRRRPGRGRRRTIATRYCSASSLNVSVATSGKSHHVSSCPLKNANACCPWVGSSVGSRSSVMRGAQPVSRGRCSAMTAAPSRTAPVG